MLCTVVFLRPLGLRLLPVIAAEVAALAPGFRALSLTVEAAP
ncbi:hypothetical protein NB851_026020, partial [Pseudomonas aeruginosa]|nr:hypothetical protein [Pseudomonas aeruginosa]